MTEYRISKPHEIDVEALAAMHAKSWLDAYPSEEHGVTIQFISEHVKKLTNKKGLNFRRGLVKEADENDDYYFRIAKNLQDDVVGFVDARRDREPELCGLYIDKSAYGSGLARQLAEPALRWLGLDNDIKLTVVAHNERAQAFYRKFGFEVVSGSENTHDNKPLHVVDMLRKGNKS